VAVAAARVAAHRLASFPRVAASAVVLAVLVGRRPANCPLT